MRQYGFAIASVAVCLVAAAAAFMLAIDAAAFRSALNQDDVRYRGVPEEELWSPRQLLPGGVGERVLGIGDDLLYRRALRAVRLSHPEMPGFSDPSFVVNRNDANAWLTDVLQSDQSAQRQSAAANLLGILSFADAIADFNNRARLLQSASERFRKAIALDPRNDEAKYNLELSLSRSEGLELTEAGGGTDPAPGGRGSRGAGAGDAGSGY